jgi:hypothetical protein
MTVLAHLRPSGLEPVTRAGWQCPACLTVYSPDVGACRCATRKPLSERLRQDEPIRLGGGLIRFPLEEIR